MRLERSASQTRQRNRCILFFNFLFFFFVKVLPADSSLNGSFPHRVLVLVFPIERQANFQFFFSAFLTFMRPSSASCFSSSMSYSKAFFFLCVCYNTFCSPCFFTSLPLLASAKSLFLFVVVLWELERLPLKRRP